MRQRDVEARWNNTTCWCTSPLACCSHTCACGSNGIAHTAPTILNTGCRSAAAARPSARGRSGAPPAGRCPGWRRAPGRAPRAPARCPRPPAWRSAARWPGSSTTAPSSTAPTSMSSSTSLGSAASSARTAGDSVSGRVAATINCSDSRISPRPIATRPSRPVVVFSRAMNATTPPKISSGDSHDRSNENTTAISAGADVGAQHHGQRRRQRRPASGRGTR